MSVSSVNSASKIQTDYMTLLITQLRNQNPLEPMNNQEMASQLTLFSQLEQLESMKVSFANVLATTNRNYAHSLLGRNVTFFSPDEITGILEKKVGRVDSVLNDPETDESLLGMTTGDGETVEEYTISLDAVILIEN